MSLFGVRVRGMAETKAALRSVQVRVELARRPAAQAGGNAVAKAMRDRAPRDTGLLVSRIGVVMENDDALGPVAKVGAHGVPYDVYVQTGTVFTEPQAYGEEAAQGVQPEVISAMAGVFKAALPR